MRFISASVRSCWSRLPDGPEAVLACGVPLECNGPDLKRQVRLHGSHEIEVHHILGCRSPRAKRAHADADFRQRRLTFSEFRPTSRILVLNTRHSESKAAAAKLTQKRPLMRLA